MIEGIAASSSIAVPSGRRSHDGAQLGEEERDAEAHRHAISSAIADVTSVP